MNIPVTQAQGKVPVTILAPDNRLNLGTADELQAAAQASIDAGARYMLLDLTNVPSTTSAGLRTIQLIARSIDQASGDTPRQGEAGQRKSRRLKLLKPSPEVEGILAIAGFDVFLEIYRDLQTAIDSFS